jgi:hexosaminidase
MSQHRRSSARSPRARRSLFGIVVVFAVLAGIGIVVRSGVMTRTSQAPRMGQARQQTARVARTDGPPTAAQVADYENIVPAPVSAAAVGGQFAINDSTRLYAPPGSASARAVADYLAALLRPPTGYALPVSDGSETTTGGIQLDLTTSHGDAQIGDEGYRLVISDDQVTITANQPGGLFNGAQTLRQLLPPQVEDRTIQQSSWTVPSGHVVDYPRYGYRAAGLDVARHFFTIEQVERYIDEISLYKIDYLHLHLTDDQGWRLEMDGWPLLTSVGGSTEVGGHAGGYYTQTQYRQLTAYAQARHVTIIPEIDVPGHVGAALASYPSLSCDGKPRPVPTSVVVNFTSLCAGTPTTDAFLDGVIRQLAALTPGTYIGVGGDEAGATTAHEYAQIVGRAAADVRAQGKIPWGWQEAVSAPIGYPSVATHWNTSGSTAQERLAAESGTKLVLDPADHTYLDQKYDAGTPLGLHWAGYVDVDRAYGWDPAGYLGGVGASAILGVEADLWTETVASSSDIDFMAFPRLPAIAEIGWSPGSTHDWTAFRRRLASQGPRWKALGVNFHMSRLIAWPAGS